MIYKKIDTLFLIDHVTRSELLGALSLWNVMIFTNCLFFPRFWQQTPQRHMQVVAKGYTLQSLPSQNLGILRKHEHNGEDFLFFAIFIQSIIMQITPQLPVNELIACKSQNQLSIHSALDILWQEGAYHFRLYDLVIHLWNTVFSFLSRDIKSVFSFRFQYS